MEKTVSCKSDDPLRVGDFRLCILLSVEFVMERNSASIGTTGVSADVGQFRSDLR